MARCPGRDPPEGEVDEMTGKLKDKADHAKDKVSDALDSARDKITDDR